MSFKDDITKELGPALSKAVLAALFSSLSRSHADEDASDPTEFSSAWKEIEHKLQGLFSNEEGSSANAKSYRFVAVTVGAVMFIALVYLFGRKRGRSQSSVLEIHKA